MRDLSRPGHAPNARVLAALSLAAALGACATTPSGPAQPLPPGPLPPSPPRTSAQGITPPFMAGRPVVRVGLLLPFSQRPQEATALYNAAELALFDHGGPNMLLLPRDSGGGDAAGAANAARALLADGADLIIGPVVRDGVEGAGQAAGARNVPVIGFSSDRSIGGQGVYLLSFQLEDEVNRIVEFATQRGIRSIAMLGPANEYGRRVEQALRAEAGRRGVSVTASELYTRSDQEAAAAGGRLAQRLQAAPAQAVLIAENGSALRSAASALMRAGVDPRRVRLMGTSAWAGGDAEREPALAGGWFVAPDPSARDAFEQRYRGMFNAEPTRLASLGYDAVALAALLSADGGPNGFTRQAIQRSDGFLGSDGLFRFRADGSIQRGLAIMEVRPQGSAPLDAAPRRFAAPAS